ncbi:hypothetical protein [Streptomyces sp. NRRL WC-3742]|uniref:hypothetical protein n=1 Tax=Streptomyces sp. NRRL WC-3742 TaxID=1463934 RepID=UPI0004C62B30|nr:hypothetical protein [Streptomyces sp. NRRL WC-3742]
MSAFTRLVDGLVCAYRPAAGAEGVLVPAAVFRPVGRDEVYGHTVAADLRHAWYTTLDALVCVTAEGGQLWRSPFEPASTEANGHHPGCEVSADGRVVWVYRPDAMAGRGTDDRCVAFDAATGESLGEEELETVGHSAVQLAHPTSGEVLVDVGEGQDGTVVYRASLAGGRPVLVRYPWDDRCLIGLSPDGRHFLTIDHGQYDLTVHAYPGGEEVFTVTVDAFGHDPETVFVEWAGGYLDQDTLLINLVGEPEDDPVEEDEEWFRTYRVDARTGQVHGEIASHGEGAYDLHPLGDGSWLTASDSGHPTRHLAP